MLVEAVICDIDGTLIDSVDLHARAWVDALHEYGHEVAFADVRRQIGKGGDQLLPVFLSKEEIQGLGEDLEKHGSKIFKERYLAGITAFPGVRPLMQRLLAEGKQLTLASSAKEDELMTYKRIAKIEDLIKVATSSDDAESSKLHPEIFQAALKRLGGQSPKRVVVVGDTPYDAEAAAKAGMRTIGLLCGGWPEDELKQAGCITVYKDPADLLARYADSPLIKDGSSA
jgi:HAD superfamily hydrolase (TIGR01549 family)